MNRLQQLHAQRQQARQQSGAKAHMIVARGMVNDTLETRERMAVQAFIGGWATPEHFQVLADMQSVMLLAGSTSDARKWAWTYAREVVGPVLSNIADRYKQGKPLTVTTGERRVLREFPTKYRGFWVRQPQELYSAACQALQEHYDARAHEGA